MAVWIRYRCCYAEFSAFIRTAVSIPVRPAPPAAASVASQPYQIQQAPDAQFRAHGRPHAGQSPPGRGQPRQWQADAPHGAQIEQRGHRCAACTLKYAAGHDGRAVHSLGKGLNTQDAGAQGDDVAVRRQCRHHLRGEGVQQPAGGDHDNDTQQYRDPAQASGHAAASAPTLCPTSMAAALWMP